MSVKTACRYCPINGCGLLLEPGHLMCHPHWHLVPSTVRKIYLAQKKLDPLSDSTQMAAIACLSEAEAALTEGVDSHDG